MEVRPLTLTVLGGAAGVTCAQTFDVSKVTIGRTRGNKLVIKDSTVSSKHCQLTWREGSWQLSDLDSTNGTSINGSEKIEAGGEVALLHGQVIHLGPEIKVLAAIQVCAACMPRDASLIRTCPAAGKADTGATFDGIAACCRTQWTIWRTSQWSRSC